MNQIVGFHKPISDFKYGHTYAQLETEHWASVLNAEVKYNNNYDDKSPAYIFLGVNYFPGDNPDKLAPLNMFGGFTEGYYEALKKFAETDAEYYSISYKLPPLFLDSIVDRAEKKTSSTFDGVDVDVCKKVREKALKVKVIQPEDFIQATNSIMYGDSQSYSMAPNGVPCVRMGGKTLFGALRRGEFKEYRKTKAKHMLFMFGSLDIRHHIFRQEDPYASMKKMLEDYVQECKEIVQLGKTVEICGPVPVPSQERKFSKHAAFKGTYYTGSKQDRVDMTFFFMEEIKRLIKDTPEITFSSYPMDWYYENSQVFEKRLERIAGAHISMIYSRRMDYGDNELNIINNLEFNDDEW